MPNFGVYTQMVEQWITESELAAIERADDYMEQILTAAQKRSDYVESFLKSMETLRSHLYIGGLQFPLIGMIHKIAEITEITDGFCTIEEIKVHKDNITAPENVIPTDLPKYQDILRVLAVTKGRQPIPQRLDNWLSRVFQKPTIRISELYRNAEDTKKKIVQLCVCLNWGTEGANDLLIRVGLPPLHPNVLQDQIYRFALDASDGKLGDINAISRACKEAGIQLEQPAAGIRTGTEMVHIDLEEIINAPIDDHAVKIGKYSDKLIEMRSTFDGISRAGRNLFEHLLLYTARSMDWQLPFQLPGKILDCKIAPLNEREQKQLVLGILSGPADTQKNIFDVNFGYHNLLVQAIPEAGKTTIEKRQIGRRWMQILKGNVSVSKNDILYALLLLWLNSKVIVQNRYEGFESMANSLLDAALLPRWLPTQLLEFAIGKVLMTGTSASDIYASAMDTYPVLREEFKAETIDIPEMRFEEEVKLIAEKIYDVWEDIGFAAMNVFFSQKDKTIRIDRLKDERKIGAHSSYASASDVIQSFPFLRPSEAFWNNFIDSKGVCLDAIIEELLDLHDVDKLKEYARILRDNYTEEADQQDSEAEEREQRTPLPRKNLADGNTYISLRLLDKTDLAEELRIRNIPTKKGKPESAKTDENEQSDKKTTDNADMGEKNNGAEANCANSDDVCMDNTNIDDVYMDNADMEDVYVDNAGMDDVYMDNVGMDDVYMDNAEIDDVDADSTDTDGADADVEGKEETWGKNGASFDAFQMYVQEINMIPKLSEQEIAELIKRRDEGSKAARDQLIEAHIRLSLAVARKFYGKSLQLEDLLSAANIGLMAAVDHYNPKRGVSFNSYAMPCIRSAIIEALAKEDGQSSMSKDAALFTTNMQTIQVHFLMKSNTFPTDEQLAIALAKMDLYVSTGMEKNAARSAAVWGDETYAIEEPSSQSINEYLTKIKNAEKYDISTISKDQETDETEDLTLEDQIEDPSKTQMYDLLPEYEERARLIEQINKNASRLTELERQVLSLHLQIGVDPEIYLSLLDISDMLRIPLFSVIVCKRNAMRKLRFVMEDEILKKI